MTTDFITHSQLSELIIRPPGQPPSRCPGALIRVSPDGTPIDWDAPGVWDDAQGGEGEPGQMSEIFLFRCRHDGNTLVVARCPDGTLRLRNAWEVEPEDVPGTLPRPLAATA